MLSEFGAKLFSFKSDPEHNRLCERNIITDTRGSAGECAPLTASPSRNSRSIKSRADFAPGCNVVVDLGQIRLLAGTTR